jgi:hypothetical protein
LEKGPFKVRIVQHEFVVGEQVRHITVGSNTTITPPISTSPTITTTSTTCSGPPIIAGFNLHQPLSMVRTIWLQLDDGGVDFLIQHC